MSDLSYTAKKAIEELDLLSVRVPDAVVLPFRDVLIAISDAFGRSGQSGGSAPYTASALSDAVKKLCLQESLSPILGTPEEWGDSLTNSKKESVLQNKRCSALFSDGLKAHYLDAIIWQGVEVWDTFTGRVYIDAIDFELISSSQYVRFPFEPKSFYVDVVRVPIDKTVAEFNDLHYIENSDGTCYYTVLKDKTQLDEVFKYYDRRSCD